MPAAPKKKKNPSAIKRARQAVKRHDKNVAVKSALKTVSKKAVAANEKKDAGAIAETLKEATKAYAKAASKGILHKNTASRKISRLAKAANKAVKA
ncbi:MAG: 30S ribosomal protein S20 [Actinomycetota bacterium]|nr:30S ribosomal protein S20 [Actinomycetota bacterium]